jgi:hypothetical protein
MVKTKVETIEQLSQHLGESEEWAPVLVAATRFRNFRRLVKVDWDDYRQEWVEKWGSKLSEPTLKVIQGIGIYHYSVIQKFV